MLLERCGCFHANIAKVFFAPAVQVVRANLSGNNVMKIESTGKSVAPTATSEPRSRPAAAPNTPSTNATDKVELSSLSASLQKAEATIAETPVVNKQRVDEIKSAIANGDFKIDANRIAEGLISSVREMLAASR